MLKVPLIRTRETLNAFVVEVPFFGYVFFNAGKAFVVLWLKKTKKTQIKKAFVTFARFFIS